MVQPTFRLTVPESLYDTMCAGTDQAFADSYLTGASLVGTTLTPRTVTGWSKMRDRKDCLDLLDRMGLTLARPTAYPGNGDRLSAKDLRW